jgi:hypothetical protein
MPGVHLGFPASTSQVTLVNFHPANGFAAQQGIALAVVLAVLLIAALAAFFAHRGGGLLMGADRRLSTSKVVAVLWTAVVGYCVLTLSFIAAETHFGIAFLQHNLGELKGVYLALLGGPYASYLFAQIAVPAKIASGSLQKGYGNGFNPADIINNDSGNTDVIDLQYVTFNLIAAIMVLVLFVPHPALHGLPAIPYAVALLTGGAAAAYVTNKGLTTNRAKISSLSPRSQRVGDVVTIAGVNLWGPTGPPPTSRAAPHTAVSIAGIPGVGSLPAAVAGDSPSAIQFVVPALPAGTPPPLTNLDVTINTNLNQADTTHGLSIVPDEPAIGNVTPNPAAAGNEVTVLGRFLAGPPALGDDGVIDAGRAEQPVVTLGGVQVQLTGSATADRLVFAVPSPPAPTPPLAPGARGAPAPGSRAPVPTSLVITRANGLRASAVLGLS